MKKLVFFLFVTATLTLTVSPAFSQNKNITPKFQKAPKPLIQPITGENFGLLPPPIDLGHIGKARSLYKPLTTIPSSYDLRTLGKVTSPKDQSICGSCWSFATAGSLESRVLILESTTHDFSEQNIVACTPDPDGPDCDRGGHIWGATNILSIAGTRNETLDPYTCPDISCGVPTCSSGLSIVKNLTDMRMVCVEPNVDVIKDAIYNYGAVYTSMYASFPGLSGYDGSSALCYTGTEDSNHAVLIVGWDDNMDAGSCGTGAWIVKNSWGTSWGDSGYFYIAYGSANIGGTTAYVEYKDSVPGETIHYYDDYGMTGAAGCDDPTVWGAVRFTPSESGNIQAVDFWAVDDNMTYEISIYDNWSGGPASLLHSQSGSLTEAGYYSIPLTNTVAVSSGDEFVVVMKLVASGYGYPVSIDDNAPIETNKCYMSCDGSDWIEVGAGLGWDIGIRARTASESCSAEVCDGIDNDCDGEIDENLIQSCGSDVGECAYGTQTCTAGDWGACEGEVGPSTEVCDDSKDNDCDGEVDEADCEEIGDINGDGCVDIMDVLCIYRWVVGNPSSCKAGEPPCN